MIGKEILHSILGLLAIFTVVMVTQNLVPYEGQSKNVHVPIYEEVRQDSGVSFRPHGSLFDPNSHSEKITTKRSRSSDAKKDKFLTENDSKFNAMLFLTECMKEELSDGNDYDVKKKAFLVKLKALDKMSHKDEKSFTEFFLLANAGMRCLQTFEKLVGPSSYNVSTRLFDLTEQITDLFDLVNKQKNFNLKPDEMIAKLEVNYIMWFQKEVDLVYSVCQKMENHTTLVYKEMFEIFFDVLQILNGLLPESDLSEKYMLMEPEEDSEQGKEGVDNSSTTPRIPHSS